MLERGLENVEPVLEVIWGSMECADEADEWVADTGICLLTTTLGGFPPRSAMAENVNLRTPLALAGSEEPDIGGPKGASLSSDCHSWLFRSVRLSHVLD